MIGSEIVVVLIAAALIGLVNWWFFVAGRAEARR